MRNSRRRKALKGISEREAMSLSDCLVSWAKEKEFKFFQSITWEKQEIGVQDGEVGRKGSLHVGVLKRTWSDGVESHRKPQVSKWLGFQEKWREIC